MGTAKHLQSYEKFLEQRYSGISDYAKEHQVVVQDYFSVPEPIDYIDPDYLRGLVQNSNEEGNLIDEMEKECMQMLESTAKETFDISESWKNYTCEYVIPLIKPGYTVEPKRDADLLRKRILKKGFECKIKTTESGYISLEISWFPKESKPLKTSHHNIALKKSPIAALVPVKIDRKIIQDAKAMKPEMYRVSSNPFSKSTKTKNKITIPK
jgi:hypothetical protein